MDDKCILDNIGTRVAAWIRENRIPLISALVCGLLAFAYVFTNKLINHDDIVALFSKGSTVSSGRWGLVFMQLIFPNFSMPWIYGILSLLLMAVAACVLIRVLNIQNKVFSAVLAGALVVFPSMTALYCYMFTSTSYALSFLLVVLSVWYLQKNSKRATVIAVCILVFSMGIYQSFVSVAASVLLVLLIRPLLQNRPAAKILRQGARYLLFLLVSVAGYLAVTWLSLKITGTEFNSSYANTDGTAGLGERFLSVYKEFFRCFTSDAYGLINNTPLRAAHLLIAAITGISVLAFLFKKGKTANKILLVVCLALLPLSINCFCLISSESVHTIVLFSFVSLYFAAAVIAEECTTRFCVLKRELYALLMAIVIAGNIYVSNTVFLQQHLMYENASAFYTQVFSQINMTPGYDQTCKVALVGNAQEKIFTPSQFRYYEIVGFSDTLINAYSRNEFILYYLGYGAQFATLEEIAALQQTEEYQQMPIYPYYGSVAKIGDYIVVRFE